MSLTTFLAQLVSLLRAELYKVVTRSKIICFLISENFIFKMYIFEVVTFFLPQCLSNQLNFSVAVRICKIHVFGKIFLLSLLSEYRTFQGGDLLQRALTHKYVWHLNEVVLRGHVISKIHISTCRKRIDTKLGKFLTLCRRLQNMTL